LEKPYAVFRFKYRSKGVLKSMFGDEVPDHERDLTVRTESSKVRREKEKLGEKYKDVGKEELIEKMVRLKMEVEAKRERREKSGKERSRGTESVARNLTESWVKRHSREPSVKDGKEHKGDKDEGWNGGGWTDPNKWS
jgi:hypothetical protein